MAADGSGSARAGVAFGEGGRPGEGETRRGARMDILCKGLQHVYEDIGGEPGTWIYISNKVNRDQENTKHTHTHTQIRRDTLTINQKRGLHTSSTSRRQEINAFTVYITDALIATSRV